MGQGMGKVSVRPPKEFTDPELARFRDMVLRGGEVERALLTPHIRRAHLLVCIHVGRRLVAVGALNNPPPQYREAITRDSHGPDLCLCGGEVGYVAVAKNFRGRGLGRRLTESLLKNCTGPLYATTRELNFPMHRILNAAGFRKTGQPWASNDRPGESMVLWILKR